MTLGTHAVVGSAIGFSFSLSPIAGFLVGFLSHFVLDMIPHWDYTINTSLFDPKKENEVESWKKAVWDLSKFGGDAILGIIVSFLFFSQGGTDFNFIYGAIGGMLPDFLQFVYVLFPKGPLKSLQSFHEYVHADAHLRDNFFLGTMSQVLIMVIAIGLGTGALLSFCFYRVDVGEKISQNKLINSAIVGASEPSLPTRTFFTGDIMLGRQVESLMNKNGIRFPFEKIAPFLETADFVVGNLEGPIPPNHEKTPGGSFSFSFNPSVAEILKRETFDLLSLANNHTFDKGKEGYDFTKRALEKEGLTPFGHPILADKEFGLNFEEGQFNILGFNATYPTFDQDKAKIALAFYEEENDNPTIVSIHWGDEYSLVSNSKQKEIAEELIKSGADLILGHHPHVVQNIQVIDGVPIVYSLGNFIFDQYFSEDVQDGLVVGISVGKNIIEEVCLYPIKSEASQPKLMDKEAADIFIKNLLERSPGEKLDSMDSRGGYCF